jgi:hypothetical protein
MGDVSVFSLLYIECNLKFTFLSVLNVIHRTLFVLWLLKKRMIIIQLMDFRLVMVQLLLDLGRGSGGGR